MATTRKKSEEDLRKQTDHIYSSAIEALNAGRLTAKQFSDRLDRARSAEKKYIGNIEKQSRFKKENAESYKVARATKYSQRAYMTGSNG